MTKKLFAVCLFAAILFSLAACLAGETPSSLPEVSSSKSKAEEPVFKGQTDPEEETFKALSAAGKIQNVEAADPNGYRKETAGWYLYETDGKHGLVDVNGTTLLSSNNDVSFCELCGVVDKFHCKYEQQNGKWGIFEQGGHGNEGALWYHSLEKCYYLDDFPYDGTFEFEGGQFLYVGICTAAPMMVDQPDGSRKYVRPERTGVYLFGDGTLAKGVRYENAFAASPFEDKDQLAAVKENGRWSYIRLDGTALFSDSYEDCRPFINETAPVKKNGKWGYIDLSGREVSGFLYEEARALFDGRAMVKKDGIWQSVKIDLL